MSNSKRIAALVVVLVALAGVLALREFLKPGADPFDPARDAIAAGDYDVAVAKLRELDLDGKEWKTHWLRARIYRRLGKMKEAREELKEAARLNGDVATLEREQVYCLAITGEVASVERELAPLMRDHPTEMGEIVPSFAYGMVRSNRFEEAWQLAALWRKQQPDDPEPLFLQAMLAQEGDPALSITRFREGLEIRPQRWKMRLRLGGVLKLDRQFEAARDEFARVARERPAELEALARCAEMEFKLGNIAAAEDALTKAEAIDPDDLDVCHVRARLAIENENWSLAENKLRTAIALEPNDAELWLLEVRRAVAVGDEAKAEYARTRLTEAKEWQDAVQNVRDELFEARTSNDDPREVAKALAKVGATARERDSSGEWHRWYFSAVTMDPTYVDARLALAEYYDSVGEDNRAAEQREQIAKLQSER